MRIYVATSFQNIPEAHEVMGALRGAGHTITHDWTTESVDPGWPLDKQATHLQACGARDYTGVCWAQTLVLINHPALRDGMCEFGIALGMGIPVVVLYPDRRRSVFFHKAKLADSVPSLLRCLS